MKRRGGGARCRKKWARKERKKEGEKGEGKGLFLRGGKEGGYKDKQMTTRVL